MPSSELPSPRSVGAVSAVAPRSALAAALLSLLVPGAGHLYAGSVRRGLAIFLAVEGLFAAGLLLGDGALLGFSSVQFPLRFDLLPEALNVGATLVAARLHPDVAYLDPRDAPHRTLALLLTALSGVGAALAAADAHALARGRRARAALRSPGAAALLSFLVPGLGHFALGRRAKGALLFAALTGLFVLGLVLSDANVVDRDRHYYYWAGQLFYGGATAIAYLLTASNRVSALLPHLDAALLFVTAAGLLNILVMIDAYAEAEEGAA